MSNTEEKGETAIKADIEGNPVSIRADGGYIADVLKACGGMVDLKLTNAYSPMLFACEGYQVVVMPMMSREAGEAQKRESEARAEAQAEATEPEAQAEGLEAEAQAQAEAEAIAEFEAEMEAKAQAEAEAQKPKRRNRKREAVGVA